MGRTVPSYRMMIEELIEELSTFKRALHGEDKIAFDNIMIMARKHASSGTITPTLDPMFSLLLSIAIEQQKEIEMLIRNRNETKIIKE
jgi:hypothetical protein